MARVLVTLVMLAASGCHRPESIADSDRFVELQGSTGTLVAPSMWKLSDGGDHWQVTSPDGRAVINVMTFTVEGSGSLEDVAQMVADNLTDAKTRWQPSKWTPLQVQGRSAIRRALKPVDGSATGQWIVIALREGDLYHILALSASDSMMEINGGFYESIMLTFKGVGSTPSKTGTSSDQ